jgi:hypothetical protein
MVSEPQHTAEELKLIEAMKDEWLVSYDGTGKLFATATQTLEKSAEHDQILSFQRGEILEILFYKPQEKWWFAASVMNRSRSGWIPYNFVKFMYSLQSVAASESSESESTSLSSTVTCSALISFRSYNSDELLFLRGEKIVVDKLNPSGPWSYGHVGSRKGYFLNDLVIYEDSTYSPTSQPPAIAELDDQKVLRVDGDGEQASVEFIGETGTCENSFCHRKKQICSATNQAECYFGFKRQCCSQLQ